MAEKVNNSKVSTATLVKSSFWYTASSFLTRAMVFITTPLFTRILTKEQYGNFTVYASWQNIFVIICGLEVYATLNRARFDYDDKASFAAYITSCLTLSTFITGVVFLAFLIFPSVFHKILLLENKYIYFMFAYLFAFPAYAMFQTKQRVEYKYKLNAVVSFIVVISSSILAVILASVISEDRLYGRVIGQYSLYIITGFAFYVYFVKQSLSVKREYHAYAFKIALPLVFSFLASSILLSSDGLIVKHMCSSEQVSYISITHTVANIIILLVQVLNNAWSPWFYDKLNIDEFDIIKKTFRAYVFIVILGTAGVLLLAPEVITVLGGKQYLEAVYIVPVVIINGVFSTLTFQFVNLETFYKKPYYSALLTGIIAILNVILDIVGIKLFGYRAVCYATAICQILLILLHYRVTQKMGIARILPISDIAVIIAITCLLIPFSLFTYTSKLIRFGSILFGVILVLSACYVFREKIVQFLKRLRSTSKTSESN